MNTRLKSLFAAGLLAAASPLAHAADDQWTDDMAAAMDTAAAEGKDIIIDFTGSDWCGWCIRLDDEVFSRDAFKTYAAENFVLVVMDFPRDTSGLTPETIAQNEAWRDKFDVAGYPTIMLLDAQGRPFGRTGYQAGGPEAYVESLEAMRQGRVTRDAALAEAESLTGVARAEKIGEALNGLDGVMVLNAYTEELAMIAEADPQDETGLTAQYTQIAQRLELETALQQIVRGSRDDAAGGIAQVDNLITEQSLEGELLQLAMFSKGQLLYMADDRAGSEAVMREAMALAPETETGQQLAQVIERAFAE